jgi:hypothetical protein
MPLIENEIPAIFKDSNLQLQFDTEGYVKIQLLSEKDIELLTQLFYKFHNNIIDNAFGASTFISNIEEKAKNQRYFISYFFYLILKISSKTTLILVPHFCIKHLAKIQIWHHIKIGLL